MVRRISLLLLTVAAILSVVTMNSQAQTVLTHHTREAIRTGQAQALGRLPGNQVMQLDVVLPLRDPAGLKTFLSDVYDPSSPTYRQFLTPKEFTARFGPTIQADYDAVVSYVKASGFQVVGGSREPRNREPPHLPASHLGREACRAQSLSTPARCQPCYVP